MIRKDWWKTYDNPTTRAQFHEKIWDKYGDNPATPGANRYGHRRESVWRRVMRQFVKRVGALPYSAVVACRQIAEEGLDKKVADALEKRGKMIALSLDHEEMYHILKSYLPS